MMEEWKLQQLLLPAAATLLLALLLWCLLSERAEPDQTAWKQLQVLEGETHPHPLLQGCCLGLSLVLQQAYLTQGLSCWLTGRLSASASSK